MFKRQSRFNLATLYDLAKKTIRSTKEIFLYKEYLIQPSEVQKPETGQKTGPRTTGKILCANEPV